MHAYDRWLLVRTSALALVLLACALGIVIATDEPLSTPAMRVARMGALSPAIGALAVVIALAQARARGELLALAALGSGPLRQARGSLVAAWFLGGIATALLLSPLADVSALFPAVQTPAQWIAEATIMIAPPAGVSVTPDGVPTLGPAITSGALIPPRPGPGAAALAIGPLALMAPPWAAATAPWMLRAAGGALSLLLIVLLLHAVAAHRVPAVTLVAAALPLAISALAFARRGDR